jgi:hypothetical protein
VRHTVRSEPALPDLPKPTSAAPAECDQPLVSIEDLNTRDRHWMDIEQGGTPIAGRCHAATPVGSARARPRWYSAAFDAWLQAVKKARLSAFRSSIQWPM